MAIKTADNKVFVIRVCRYFPLFRLFCAWFLEKGYGFRALLLSCRICSKTNLRSTNPAHVD